MGWVDLPLTTQSDKDSLAYVSDAHLVNLMLVPASAGSSFPFALKHTPGITLSQSTQPSTSILGMIHYDGWLWYVDGTAVKYTNGFDTTTATGAVSDSTYYRMCGVGDYVVLVNGTNAYAVSTVTFVVTACSRGNFSDVTGQDGYALFTETATDSVYASDLDDPLTIGALSFTTADAWGGICVGLVSHDRDLMVLKENSAEFFQNIGGGSFPFQRSGAIERGCVNKFTIQKRQGTVIWVGDDLKVYRLRGYQPEKVSNRRVEASIEGQASTDEKFASIFSHDGASYYHLACGDINGGLMLNLDTGLWHYHAAYATWTAGVFAARAMQFIVDFVDEENSPQVGPHTYVATTNTAGTPRLGKFSTAIYTDSGLATPNIRQVNLPPVVPSGGGRAVMAELEIVGLPASAASTVELAWSDNGGVSSTTWGGHPANGANNRLRWHRLGSFYRREIMVKFQTNSPVAISGVRARIEVGAS